MQLMYFCCKIRKDFFIYQGNRHFINGYLCIEIKKHPPTHRQRDVTLL